MSVSHVLQESFAAGEISPLLHGRLSTEGYRSGCKTMVNFRPDARGPAIARKGSLFIAEEDGDNGRVIDIQGDRDAFYIGLLTDFRLRLFDLLGQPVSSVLPLITEPRFSNGGTAWTTTVNGIGSAVTFDYENAELSARTTGTELITNGDFAALGTGWTIREDTNSTVTFVPGEVQLIPDQGGGGNVRIAGISQLITVVNTSVEHFIVVNGDFSNGLLSVKIGLSDGSAEFLDTKIAVDSVLAFTPTADCWISIQCEKPEIQANANLVSVQEPGAGFARFSQSVTGLTAGNHTLLVKRNLVTQTSSNDALFIRVGTGDNDGTYFDQQMTGDTLQVVVNIPTTTATVSIHADSVTDASMFSVNIASIADSFDVVTPWPEADLNEIHIVRPPGNDEIHFLHKNYPPQRIVYDLITETFLFEAVPNGNFPVTWTGSNYPRTGTYLWGRMWYGGPPDAPQRFWGSRSGVITDFDVPLTGNVAVDPVTYTIQKFGVIKWMEGTKALLIGTTFAEFIADSPSRFTDINEIPDILQQSAYGSNEVQPVPIGDQVFYVSADGKKLRAMQYEWAADNWLSNDLTFFSEHITSTNIIQLTWAQNPDNVLNCVLADGTGAQLTYQRDQNVFGWNRYTIEGGAIRSIVSPQINGTDFNVAIFNITGGKIALTYPAFHRSGYVDQYVTKADSIPFTTLDGLDHLEGRTVQVLVDDIGDPNKQTNPLSVHPDRKVIGGSITLQDSHTEAVAGLKYVSKMKLLPLQSPIQTGSRINFNKKHAKIYVAVLSTLGIIINDQSAPDRGTETLMNTREPDKTERIEVTDFGWSTDGGIEIRQELPLPATITQIDSETEFDND